MTECHFCQADVGDVELADDEAIACSDCVDNYGIQVGWQ